jgi:methyl-accepting chemotaxis protein
MGILRRLLGVFVMIAGILGLLLSLAGLAGLWMARPVVTESMNTIITTLAASVDVSQETLVITNEALGATATSVDALSDMLDTTATTVEDTQPVVTQLNDLLGETLPTTLNAAADSLEAAEAAAESLESAIQSFDMFRMVLGTTPLLSAFVPASQQSYNPEKPLAESLGELRGSIEEMPPMFEGISDDVDKAGGNLDLIKGNLSTMSQSVSMISTSLRQYQAMIGESQASMTNLESMLVTLHDNLAVILNGATIALGVFLAWLLAAQVVILSQGWELYHGTAGRMDGPAPEPVVVETEAAPTD